jgi:integrase
MAAPATTLDLTGDGPACRARRDAHHWRCPHGRGTISTLMAGRSFHRICEAHKLRRIKVHHLRHTTATLLKNLGVPARDAQIILGHSRLAVTLEIYTHEDKQAQWEALGRISEALSLIPEIEPDDQADDDEDDPE